MDIPFTTDELSTLYSRVNALRAEGNEEGAQKVLTDNLARLPETLRTEIMLEMFTSTLETLEFRRKIQEEGLAAARALQGEMKKGSAAT